MFSAFGSFWGGDTAVGLGSFLGEMIPYFDQYCDDLKRVRHYSMGGPLIVLRRGYSLVYANENGA